MDSELNVLEQTNILRIKSAFTKEECKEIVNQILKFKERKDTPLFNNANNGCWTGQPHFHNGFTTDIEQLLVSVFKQSCSEYEKQMPSPLSIARNNCVQTDKKDWELWAWANVNEPGSENREHVHTGYYLSGVAYFQSEGTGRLEFMPYNYTYKITHRAWPYYGVSYYEPVDGEIILFPSFLLHKVETNHSNKQRINMAFNAVPLSKEIDTNARY